MTIFREISTALRSLVGRPAFTFPFVATLALGIAASTAMFAVVQAALLRPLPFQDPERLYVLAGVAGPEQDFRGGSYAEISDWKRMSSSFEDVVIYDETFLNLSGVGSSRQLEAEAVSPGFFQLLGVRPALGRTFTAQENLPGAAGTAVIGHSLWESQFGRRADVVGQMIRLEGQPFEIIGVMPQRFSGLSFDSEIWVPHGPFVTENRLADRGNRWLLGVGRLRRGVTRDAAQRDLDAVAARLGTIHPDTNSERGVRLRPLREAMLDDARPVLFVLTGGAALLLLIALANCVNLQLLRGRERRLALQIRSALGASRTQIIRHLAIESLLLSTIAAAAGVALAAGIVHTLIPLIPEGALPDYVNVSMNAGVTGFAVVVATAIGLLVAIVPALSRSTSSFLRESRTAGGSWRLSRPSLQQMIVGAEVALAVVVLTGAGLTIRSLGEQLAIDPGFRSDGVLAARLSLTGDRYDRDKRNRFIEELVAKAANLPGVKAAAAGSDVPLRGQSSAGTLRRDGHPIEEIRFYRHLVTPDFFRLLEIPLVRGRLFSGDETADGEGVAIVSDAFAKRLWPVGEAVGRRIFLGDDPATVIGVVGNVHFRDLTTGLMDPSDDPDVYFSVSQITPSTVEVLVRTDGHATALAPSLRAIVESLDPAIPLYQVAPLSRAVAAQTALGRLLSALLAFFGAGALLLATFGLYGVLAYLVAGRRREIAVRAAIGARPADLHRMVTLQALSVIAAGLAVGTFAAILAGRVLSTLLYETSGADPVVLSVTALILATTGLFASWIPARKAAAIEPRTALQEE